MTKSRPKRREESVEPAPEKPAAPETPSRVKLQLKGNDFVRGRLCKAGSIHEFSPKEAQRLLATTDKWTHA